jgi:tetratricopeptide (TPR) repeat protein
MVETAPEASLLGKIAGYTEILAKDPRSTVFVPLSEAYRKMGLLEDAIEVAGKGVQTLANYAPGYIALGRALAEHGEWERAAAAFERTLVLEPGNMQGLKGLARVRLTLKQREPARELLKQILAAAPGDEQAAQMLASLGAGEAARPAVTAAPSVVQTENPQPAQAASDAEPPIATATLAEIYERQGLLRKAFKIYRELYQADAKNRELYDKLISLKQRIEAGEEGASPATTSPVATLAPAQEQSMSPPEAPTGPTPDEKTVEVLNRWLASIRRRREHVR